MAVASPNEAEEAPRLSAILDRRLPNALLRASVLLDLAIIVGVSLLFVRPVLNFDQTVGPSHSTDWESLTAPMTLARQSILEHAEFPLWNPYFKTGTPFMGEPRTYLLNPLASVPALAFGALNGSKVTAALCVIGAGLAMYYLASVLGISRPFRLWAGLGMAMSGSIAARIWAGHFNFIVGVPFVPLVFALTLEALRRRGVIYPILAGLACSLLFLTGHVHYTIFAMPGLIVTFLFVLVEQGWRDGRWSAATSTPVLVRGLAVVAWTLGFSAIALVPQWESQDRIWRPTYDLSQSHTLLATAFDFFVADHAYLSQPLYAVAGRWTYLDYVWWEYYSYVGVLPLLGLALVVAALRQAKHQFAIIWSAALFALYLTWAAAAHTFWNPAYGWIPSLTNLRYPSRTLLFALPFLLSLAALGLGYATDWLAARRRWPLPWPRGWSRRPVPFGFAAAILLIALSFYSLRDVFQTNQELIDSVPRLQDRTALAEWLRQREGDSSVFYVVAPYLFDGPPHEFYERGVKRLDAHWVYHFVPILPPVESGQQAASITPRPKYAVIDPDGYLPADSAPYVLTGPSQQLPPDAVRIGTVDDRPIYELTQSPFYASTYSSADPPIDASYPWRAKTQEASARIVSANVIEVVAQAPPGHDRLLVLESFYPGWRLEIDGRRAGGPDNYAGFLSTEALPGEHTYTFVFDPASFRYGAAITIGTLLGAVLLLSWRAARRLGQRRQRSTEGRNPQ